MKVKILFTVLLSLFVLTQVGVAEEKSEKGCCGVVSSSSEEGVEVA